jgi:hypothetical protein
VGNKVHPSIQLRHTPWQNPAARELRFETWTVGNAETPCVAPIEMMRCRRHALRTWFFVVLDLHGASWLDIIVIIVAVAANTAQVVAFI